MDLSSSGSVYLVSPTSQTLLKQCTFALQDTYTHVSTLLSKERLGQLVDRAETLNEGRYVVRRLIGQGAFGKVVEAFDHHTERLVAIKIVDPLKSKAQTTLKEIAILTQLSRVDTEKGFFVRLYDHFKWNGHWCIVTELLAKSLFQLLQAVDFKGFSLVHVRIFGWQLLVALCLLSSNGVVHCDLKPENIMLRQENMSGIKIVDFGSSYAVGQQSFRYVQSRYYRAPEVIFGMEYSHPVDVWSVGCILAELHMGKPLFQGNSQAEQIAKIAQLRGLPPLNMLMKNEKARKFFILTDIEAQAKQSTRPPGNLEELMNIQSGGPGGRWKAHPDHSLDKYKAFLDLLDKMLEYDPKKRISPEEALSHSFFQDVTVKQENTQDNCKFQVPFPLPPSKAKAPVPWPKIPYFLLSKADKSQISKGLRAMATPPYSKQSTEVSRTSPLSPGSANLEKVTNSEYRPSSLQTSNN